MPRRHLAVNVFKSQPPLNVPKPQLPVNVPKPQLAFNASLASCQWFGGFEFSHSYRHSRKTDLPITHLSPFRTWLSVLLFFSSSAKTALSGQGICFAGGIGNTAIATALPTSFCVNIKCYMEFLYLMFYACLRLWFLDVETDPGQRRPVPTVCILLCSNVRSLAGNLSSHTVDILLCSEILVSDIRHVSELLV